jgi:type IV pilus assembly protein PilV
MDMTTVQTKISRRHRGFTLVEALVALLALSIGLLGVAALQMTGLKSNLSASWRSQATYLSYDIIDRMRANRNQRNSYSDAGAPPAAGSVEALDLAAWTANIAAALPGGAGTVTLGPPDNTTVTVEISWDDSRGAQPRLVFRTTSRI